MGDDYDDEKRSFVDNESIDSRRNDSQTLNLSSRNIKSMTADMLLVCPDANCINLTDNKLEVIPEDVLPMTLVELYISNNLFSTVPIHLTSLPLLHTLSLSNNDITYESLISDQWKNPPCMKSLKRLQLSANLLTAVPEWICSLEGLEVLGLSSNQISLLPTDLGRLTRLRHFSVAGNKLKSLVPSVKELMNLRCIDISDNNMEIEPVELECLAQSLALVICEGNPYTLLGFKWSPPEEGRVSLNQAPPKQPLSKMSSKFFCLEEEAPPEGEEDPVARSARLKSLIEAEVTDFLAEMDDDKAVIGATATPPLWRKGSGAKKSERSEKKSTGFFSTFTRRTVSQENALTIETNVTTAQVLEESPEISEMGTQDVLDWLSMPHVALSNELGPIFSSKSVNGIVLMQLQLDTLKLFGLEIREICRFLEARSILQQCAVDYRHVVGLPDISLSVGTLGRGSMTQRRRSMIRKSSAKDSDKISAALDAALEEGPTDNKCRQCLGQDSRCRHPQNITHSGYLNTRDQKGKWKNRWCVLRDHCLITYRSPQDVSVGHVSKSVLPGYTVSIASGADVKKNERWVLKFSHCNMSAFFVQCENQISLDMWMSTAIRATLPSGHDDEDDDNASCGTVRSSDDGGSNGGSAPNSAPSSPRSAKRQQNVDLRSKATINAARQQGGPEEEAESNGN